MDTRNIEMLIGMHVRDSDNDKVGKVRQVWVNEQTGQPAWMSVRTGLFGSAESFVPMDDRVRVEQDEVTVPFHKDMIKQAPRIDAEGELSSAQQDELYQYYGIAQPGGQRAGGRQGETTNSRQERHRSADESASPSGAPLAGSADQRDRGAPVTGAAGGRDASMAGATAGRDRSPEGMTRSEERLRVGTQQVESGRVRLVKHVVTEHVTTEVPVRHEEVRLEREPIADGRTGGTISEDEQEVILHAEKPVVDKETVAVERVNLSTDMVTEQQQVDGDIRKERIDVDGDPRDAAKNDRRPPDTSR